MGSLALTSCFSLLGCIAPRYLRSQAISMFLLPHHVRWTGKLARHSELFPLPDVAQHGGFRAPSWLPSFELRMGGLSGNSNVSCLI